MLLSGPDKSIDRTPLLADLQEVLRSGEPIYDRALGCNGLLLISNTVPVRSQNAIVGAISTFRDKTEMSQLVQRLDGMMSYVDALRTTSHEFMNKLHVILGLLNMKSYDKLEEYVLQTAHAYQADIGEIQHRIKSPVVAGFLIGKIQRAKERGFTLNLAEESLVPDCPNEKQVTVLVTVLGNLIENALDAMSGQEEGEVSLLLHYQDGWLSGEVSDDGPGIPAANIDAIFNKGFSTKGENRGVGLFLANQQLHELGGTLSVESEPGVFTQFLFTCPGIVKGKSVINVLIVDDDAMVAELNRLYVARIPGFSCCGTASTLGKAQEMITTRRWRSIWCCWTFTCSRIAASICCRPFAPATRHRRDYDTSAADAATVQTAMHYGVVDYLIKPFQFPRFEEALTAWREKRKLMTGQPYYEQADVDRLLHGGTPEAADARKLPKGLTAQTLRTLCQWIDSHPDVEFSTDELAAAVNISRVSCRKYLIWLAQINILYTTIHYGATGRPVYRYRLVAEQYGLLKQYSQ